MPPSLETELFGPYPLRKTQKEGLYAFEMAWIELGSVAAAIGSSRKYASGCIRKAIDKGVTVYDDFFANNWRNIALVTPETEVLISPRFSLISLFYDTVYATPADGDYSPGPLLDFVELGNTNFILRANTNLHPDVFWAVHPNKAQEDSLLKTYELLLQSKAVRYFRHHSRGFEEVYHALTVGALSAIRRYKDRPHLLDDKVEEYAMRAMVSSIRCDQRYKAREIKKENKIRHLF